MNFLTIEVDILLLLTKSVDESAQKLYRTVCQPQQYRNLSISLFHTIALIWKYAFFWLVWKFRKFSIKILTYRAWSCSP